jgi:ATP-dependent helicase/nuclease subunit B
VSAALDAAAHALLTDFPDTADFSTATVLLPQGETGKPFVQALLAASNRPAIIPPQLTTLHAWSAAAPLAPASLADSRRQSLLYASLRQKKWFADADLWPLVNELISLFDALLLDSIDLPADADDFAERIAQAYATRRNTALDFEASLVHTLWFALADQGIDRQQRYLLGLSWQAAHAAGPLYLLGLPPPSRAERDFFARHAARQQVVSLPLPSDDALQNLLAAAWADPRQATSLPQRAQSLGSSSPLARRVSLQGTADLESLARAALARICQWLTAGHTRIALVSLDRLAARRLRALLERDAIHVRDESGWSLSTTAAASGVDAWLECVQQNFAYEPLLALLKSPLLNAAGDRLAALRQIEAALRKHGPTHHLQSLRQNLSPGDHAAHHLLDQLEKARIGLDRRQTLADWLSQLETSLNAIGMYTALQSDAAGHRLLALLHEQRVELHDDTVRFSPAECRRWLAEALEHTRFFDTSIDSPVVLCGLNEVALRDFSAVLLLGCDAAHLPGEPASGAFFNIRVHRELGLETQTRQQQASQQILARLLADTPALCALWQAQRDGEANPLSPWLARLDILHRLAWGHTLSVPMPAAPVAPAMLRPIRRPAPQLPAAMQPGRISVSAYNTLVSCPYRFFAQRILGLREDDDISDEADKRDYGICVHQILHDFHQTHPQLLAQPREQLQTHLDKLSRQVFAPFIQQDFFAAAWQLRWLSRVPAYLDWALERECGNGEGGWLWQAGEILQSRDFVLDQQQTLTLEGRLDRLDQRGDRLAVLDYKTLARSTLNSRLAEHEDTQLATYAMLVAPLGALGEVAYVPLDDDSFALLASDLPADELAERETVRLLDTFNALAAGAGLPANGSASACQHCPFGGLCRKGHWQEDAP